MNSLRTTERSLNLLKSSYKMKTSRALKFRPLDLYLPNSQPSRSYSLQKISKPFNFRARIKLNQCCLKQFSKTTAPGKNEPRLLNPNKPGPKSLADLTAEPIVPLTMHRFPKGSADMPSVTRVLSATMPASSQFVLDRWRESMIKKLGVAGFNKYTNDTFERGRALHALIAKYLLGQGDPTLELSTEVVNNLWKSIRRVVEEKISNVRLVEHAVIHPQMNYRGIVDCVAFYREELVVIDFKTAEKPKKNVESLYDNPLQVTAYCAAINNDTSIPESVIDRNITSGLVIVAYCDGSDASMYYLNSDQIANNYWKKWTERLDQFTQMESMKQPRPNK